MINIRIPWQVWAAGGVILACFICYKQGQHNVRQEWDASIKRGKGIVDNLKNKVSQVNTVVETKVEYRDRIIEVKGKTRETIRKEFVPTNNDMLSGGFRLYYDAAVTDTVPDTAGISLAPPVSVADVADTTDRNYQLCHKAYNAVEGWQEWYREQARISQEAIEANKNGRH